MMDAENDLILTRRDSDRAWRFDLVLPLLFRPRATLARIVENNTASWRTPVALLVLAAVAHSLAAGSIKAAAAAGGQITFPPGFEFYTPEQQAQFQQAATATNNATFNYVLPALGAALGVVLVWLLVGGLLHLILTFLGGRGTSRGALNVAAWAALPGLARYAVQIAYMLLSDRLVAAPGLSGFAPAGEGMGFALLSGMLGRIDIYLLWQLALLYLGVRLSSRLPRAKSALAVLLAVAVTLALWALPKAILAQFGDLTIIRPFL